MGKVSNLNARTYNATLSAREVRLLAGWERERRVVVTMDDIRASVGSNTAPDVAHALVRKHALQRLRPGTYLIRPFRSMGRPAQVSTAVAVEALLHKEPHYLGGLWAVSLHGLSEQRYSSILDAFVAHRLAPRSFGAGKVRFHVLAPASFEYGVTSVLMEGLDVRVSDLERTVLDAFDHSRIFGGLLRALELFSAHLARLDRTQLVSYALAGSKLSTCQRLGVLLEREGATSRSLSKLKAQVGKTRSLLSMNPTAPRTGPVNRTWNVVENDR